MSHYFRMMYRGHYTSYQEEYGQPIKNSGTTYQSSKCQYPR
ncbi:hypothetical protein [Xanthomarina sp.]|nr:hypothetical protein [Xanthomarina sp.]